MSCLSTGFKWQFGVTAHKPQEHHEVHAANVDESETSPAPSKSPKTATVDVMVIVQPTQRRQEQSAQSKMPASTLIIG